jgi:IS605 OrfB family transposase
MIRSTKVSIKFTNTNKRNKIKYFIEEYSRVMKIFIEKFWEMEYIPRFIDKEERKIITSWLSARAIQAAGQQASGIVRATRAKKDRQKFIINKLIIQNKIKNAKKLQKIYDYTKMSKPNIKNIQPELDSRFVKIEINNGTSFDGWITLTCIGNKTKIKIPFKRTKHFNKLLTKGKLKSNIRIGDKDITIMFYSSDIDKTQNGDILGIDIGQKTAISVSNGFYSIKNKTGHDLESITKILSRKKKGSKGFKRTQNHRKNYINWSINQLNLKNIKQINVEDIKNIRKFKKTSRNLSHWTYTEIFEKLENKCEEEGVLMNRISPRYTSQRCSSCGWTCKSNRKKKLFNCGVCGYFSDADLNASLNIALPLMPLNEQQFGHSIQGFYWNVQKQEPIVPVV